MTFNNIYQFPIWKVLILSLSFVSTLHPSTPSTQVDKRQKKQQTQHQSSHSSKKRNSKRSSMQVFLLVCAGISMLVTISSWVSSPASTKNQKNIKQSCHNQKQQPNKQQPNKQQPNKQQPNKQAGVTIAARWRIAETDSEECYSKGILAEVPLLQLMPCVVIDTKKLALEAYNNLKKALSEPSNEEGKLLWEREGAEVMTQQYSKYDETFMNYGKKQDNACYGSPFLFDTTSSDVSSEFIYTKNAKHCDPKESLKLQDLDHTPDALLGHSFYESLQHIATKLRQCDIPYEIEKESHEIVKTTYDKIVDYLKADEGKANLLIEVKNKSTIADETKLSNAFGKLKIEDAFAQYNPAFKEIDKAIKALVESKV